MNLGRNQVTTYAVRDHMVDCLTIEDKYHGPSGYAANNRSRKLIQLKILRVLRIILVVLPEHPSDTKVLTMKMEILLEPTSNKLLEILLKMNLPDHRIKLWWKWRYLVPVESIHSPMLTLNVFNQRHHDNQKTYNTASATLISNVMIKKSVSMPVRKSQRHMKVMLPNKDDQEILMRMRSQRKLKDRTSLRDKSQSSLHNVTKDIKD
ncbi:hypothetical protein Tco_0871253 [Tanacetum coccineum]